MNTPIFAVLAVLIACCVAQRSPYAGRNPIGYPSLQAASTTANTQTDGLGNRFGEGNDSGTTQRLPIEARGDRDLIERLSKLPLDSQPFWFINWQALEQHRNRPQTYPQKPNPFVDETSDARPAF